MSRKTLLFSEDLEFPPLRRGYKAQESGFIQKVKSTKKSKVDVYFPELPRFEHKWNRSRTLSKSNSLGCLNSSRKEQTNVVDSKIQLEGKNTRNSSLQPLPDLPSTYPHQKDSTSTGEQLKISHSKQMHTERASRREKTYSDEHSLYKTDENSQSKCSNSTFPRLPQSRVSQLNRAKSNLLSTHTIRMTKLPLIETSEMSQASLVRKWKTDCKCLRCCIMSQQFEDQDMQAYAMWGSYPCQNLQLQATTTVATSSVKHDY